MKLHITNLRQLCCWRLNGLCINKYVKWELVGWEVNCISSCCCCMLLSWMNFAMVMRASVCLSCFPCSSSVLCDASSKLPHYVRYLLSRHCCLWFHSPYAEYLLSLVLCENSCFEVCYRKRLAEECHRECYWRGTGGAVRVWRVWRRGKQCFVSSLCLLLPWVVQPRQEFESKCIRITKFIAAKLSK